MSEKAPFLVFSGTNSRYLAEKICASLNCPLGQMNITHFADGEFAVSYEESIRGANVFLVQSTFPNSDNLMELLLMIDAAKRASAKTINAVVPYFGWARQDRKDKPRVSIGAKLVADLLSVAGKRPVGSPVSLPQPPPVSLFRTGAVQALRHLRPLRSRRDVSSFIGI